jgi:hypothetical protein
VLALAAHKRQQAEERLKVGANYQNYDLVFAALEGTPLMIRNLVRRHYKPTLKRAKLPASRKIFSVTRPTAMSGTIWPPRDSFRELNNNRQAHEPLFHALSSREP